MLLSPLFMFIMLHFQLSYEKENISDMINLVNDFLVKQNSPTKIIAYVCWPNDVKLKLWKQLSENNYPSKISDVKGSLYNTLPEEHQMYLLDAGCDGSTNILKQAQQMNLFNQPFRWLIWGTHNESIFNDFYFGVDSKVFVIVKIGLEYQIKSLYKHTENSSRFIENSISAWSHEKGFLYMNDFSAPKNRTNLMGHHIRTSYVITNPDSYNHLWDYRDKHIDAIGKVNWLLIHHLMSFVNGTDIKIFRDTWGYRNATTNLYSGLIGDLQTGRADLAGSSTFVTLDRVQVVDYIATTALTKPKFIFKAPPLSYTTNIFTHPFDTYVWYCSFALIAGILIIVYIIVIWEWRDPIFKKKIIDLHTLKPSIFDVFMMEVGAITQQGTDAEPRSNAGKIATIFTFIALMFMYTSYSAIIVVLLQSTTESIRTLEDLLESRMSLGVEDIPYSYYYFETAKEPIRKAIYEKKVAPKGQKPNYMTIREGIERVQRGFFAFHVELSTGYNVVGDIFQESEKCALKEMEFQNFREPWLAVKKKWSYKQIVKVGLQRIHETGVQQREINLLYTKKPTCHSKGGNFGSAGLYDCYGAFLIFGVGVAFSAILLLFEILLKKYEERRRHLNMGILQIDQATVFKSIN